MSPFEIQAGRHYMFRMGDVLQRGLVTGVEERRDPNDRKYGFVVESLMSDQQGVVDYVLDGEKVEHYCSIAFIVSPA